MDITKTFAHYEQFTPAADFFTLKDLGQPQKLFDLLHKPGYGLALIAGEDAGELRRTLAGIAHTFQSKGQSVLSLRTGEIDPFPGVKEIYTNSIETVGKYIARKGYLDVIFMDALDTKEKISFAVNASAVGATVVAPVIAYSVWDAINNVLKHDVSSELLANSLVYVAHQMVAATADKKEFDILVVDEASYGMIVQADF